MSTAEKQDLYGYTGFFQNDLKDSDPAVYAALEDELHRQNDGIELIASENIVSRAVMQAVGSVNTNKYAEGYAGRRYYGGCEYVDVVEELAIERVCQLALRQIRRFSLRCYSRAILIWACRWPLVGI